MVQLVYKNSILIKGKLSDVAAYLKELESRYVNVAEYIASKSGRF